jgi:hypothetical protein
MIEQRGLSGPEKTAQDRYRNAAIGAVFWRL